MLEDNNPEMVAAYTDNIVTWTTVTLQNQTVVSDRCQSRPKPKALALLSVATHQLTLMWLLLQVKCTAHSGLSSIPMSICNLACGFSDLFCNFRYVMCCCTICAACIPCTFHTRSCVTPPMLPRQQVFDLIAGPDAVDTI